MKLCGCLDEENLIRLERKLYTTRALIWQLNMPENFHKCVLSYKSRCAINYMQMPHYCKFITSDDDLHLLLQLLMLMTDVRRWSECVTLSLY